MSTTTTVIQVELFNQISLQNIVKLTYDEAILSKNFTTIIKILKQLQFGFDGLRTENDKRLHEIKVQHQKNAEQDKLLQVLRKENANLKNDLTKFQGDQSSIGTDLRQLLERLDKQEKVTQTHSGDIQWLKDHLSKLEGDVRELQDMSTQFVQIADYTIKIQEIEARIQALEDQLREKIRAVEKEIERVQELQKRNQERTEAQISRLDEDQFDQIKVIQIERDINELRMLINSIGNSKNDQPVTVPVKDPETDRMIRDLTDRVEKLQRELQELKKKLKALQNRLNEIESRPATIQQVSSSGPTVMPKQFDDLKERVKVLQTHNKSHLKRLEGHDGTLDRHQVQIDELKKMIEALSLQIIGVKGNGDGLSEEAVKEKINQLRNELLSRLKAMKRDIQQFVKLEKLNEELTLLLQKLADQEQTQRGFYFIQKKINEINNMVLFMMNEHDNGDDPLGAQRPLWSCLSCDKDFPGYQARLGDFQTWSQLPARGNSPEQMTIFGQGFIQEQNRKQDEFMKTSLFGWSQQEQANTATSSSGKPFTSSKAHRNNLDQSKSEVQLESINQNPSSIV